MFAPYCRFAFQFNPALQPRNIVVMGCISQEADDVMVQRLLHVLIVVSVMVSSSILSVFIFLIARDRFESICTVQ